jgi:excisionase family DNA binding protein
MVAIMMNKTDIPAKVEDYAASKLWTVKQLSDHCELSEDYLWKLAREKKIKSVKIGKSIRIKHQDYLEFISSL